MASHQCKAACVQTCTVSYDAAYERAHIEHEALLLCIPAALYRRPGRRRALCVRAAQQAAATTPCLPSPPGVDDLEEQLAGAGVEDKDGAVDGLCGQVTLEGLVDGNAVHISIIHKPDDLQGRRRGWGGVGQVAHSTSSIGASSVCILVHDGHQASGIRQHAFHMQIDASSMVI